MLLIACLAAANMPQDTAETASRLVRAPRAVTPDALAAEVRLYDRLFVDPQPDAGGKDFKASLNPKSRKIVAGFVESSLRGARPGDRFQFERHGYFVADIVDHRAERPVFNRTTTLRDTWSR